MYKYSNGQISLADFKQPVGMNLKASNRCHTVPDRIVSVSQPFLRPIVSGKAGKPVEFGARLDISVVDGWSRLECVSFDAYKRSGESANHGRALLCTGRALSQPDSG